MSKTNRDEAVQNVGGNAKRKLFILYIPGGGVLGQFPLAVLDRLENLTGRYTAELFQASQGVSTGAILAGGLNIRDPENPNRPKFTAGESLKMMRDIVPQFFPPKPQRFQKMMTASIINGIKAQVDPGEVEAALLRYARRQGVVLRQKNLADDDMAKIKDMETLLRNKWFSERDRVRILKTTGQLIEKYPDLEEDIGVMGELASMRMTSGGLTRIFTKAAIAGMDFVKNKWAKDYWYSREYPDQIYKDLFGDVRMKDSLHSVYISAYDIENHRVVTAFSRKKDLFSTAPDTPTVTSDFNYMIRDAVLASTCNPFAYGPYKMEDGTIATDKAHVHSPLPGTLNIWRNKPDDCEIQVVILGTGKFLTTRLKGDALIEHYKHFGVPGNLINGQEMAEIEGYIMGQFRESFQELVPADSIIEITPRLSPRTYDEYNTMPNRNILDSSPDNQRRLDATIKSFLEEADGQIRSLAQKLVDNLFMLGKMQAEEYFEVCQRIGIHDGSTCPVEALHQKQSQTLPAQIDEDGTSWLNSIWRRVSSFAQPKKAYMLKKPANDDLPPEMITPVTPCRFCKPDALKPPRGS